MMIPGAWRESVTLLLVMMTSIAKRVRKGVPATQFFSRFETG